MPTAEAHVATDRAGRYLQQLCSHASRLRHGPGHGFRSGRGQAGPSAEATSDTTGRITLGTARCELTAGPTELALRAEADDEQQLRALQEAVTRTLERVGRRDGLTVVWG
ncbi:DUF2218 domain-containing protein [Catenulispora sp. NL8]|uniref:DUF2218 domain-containing protein n=1 Tax=Catenulispora pinistramenti TaxID=2705254 RepID=A0ABS5KMD8_9ACTN|nr:DUF2218 domain-containing protein [Catenulispora pinistramenti]MBS2547215.1 DUF2218 domain-containing protein [Catenulispora pinistramenti]